MRKGKKVALLAVGLVAVVTVSAVVDGIKFMKSQEKKRFEEMKKEIPESMLALHRGEMRRMTDEQKVSLL